MAGIYQAGSKREMGAPGRQVACPGPGSHEFRPSSRRRIGSYDAALPAAWRRDQMVCARFVTDSGVFLIIPAHCSARRHRDLVLPQQTLTRTYAGR